MKVKVNSCICMW